MGFDTMASFKLLLQSIPKATDDECLSPRSVKRQDSFTMLSDNKRRGSLWGPDIPLRATSPQKLLRPNQPLSLPAQLTAPSFQSAKSRWSPPPSPGLALVRSRSEPPLLTATEKSTLASQLFAAACVGDLAAIESLLEREADINSSVLVPGLFEAFRPAKSGQLSPLAGASLNNQLEAVKFLLKNGAEINPSTTRSSSSPLHQACRKNNIDVVRYLLQHGAQVDIVDSFKVTPVMYASKHSSPNLVSLLLEHKPDLNAVSFIDAAAIHWSVWPGKTEVTELLLQARADPNMEMANGNTALHCAVLTGSVEMVKMLLRYGADPLRRNESEETPLRLAEAHSESESEDMSRVLKAAIFDMRLTC